MNKNINYYGILNIKNNASAKEIKTSYYKISKETHPDIGGDENIFRNTAEAYKILSNLDLRKEYDKKSKFGNSYDEMYEYLEFEFKNDAKSWNKEQQDESIIRDQLNIVQYIDDTFLGTIEYERWVYCKACDGSGMDISGKIAIGFSKNIEYFFSTQEEIKAFILNEDISDYTVDELSYDEMLIKLELMREILLEREYEEQKEKYLNSNVFLVLKIKNNNKKNYLDVTGECDMCEGTGKWGESDCFYCSGVGKVNSKVCASCKGEKRMLGKQKLTGIKIPKNAKDHKLQFMGSVSKDVRGKYGHLWIVKK